MSDDGIDNVEWLRNSRSEEWCSAALNKAADEIENLRSQLEILRTEFVEMQTRLILETAEVISTMKLKNKKLPDGFDEETVLKIIARCAPGGVNE